MKNEKIESYQVQAVLHLMVATEIKASSLESAVETAKAMKKDQFVNILGECINGNFKITGVYETSPKGL